MCKSVMWFSDSKNRFLCKVAGSHDLHFNEVWANLDPANDGHWED